MAKIEMNREEFLKARREWEQMRATRLNTKVDPKWAENLFAFPYKANEGTRMPAQCYVVERLK